MSQVQYVPAVDDRFTPILHLWIDLAKARRLASRPRSSLFHRRNYLRCLFDSIEAAVFLCKEIVLYGSAESGAALTVGELLVLQETSYSLDEYGDLIEHAQTFSLSRSLRFLVALINRLFSVSIDVGAAASPGWQAFQESLNLRNKLLHPRPSENLSIDDADLTLLCRTHDWIDGLLNQISAVIMG